MKLVRAFFIFISLFWVAPSQCKPVEIILWHSMAGQAGLHLVHLINGFHNSQTDYRIKPVYKGDYLESLTSFAAAFRAKQPPALIQVFEVGTSTMLAPKGVIKPVDELMKEQGLNLPKASFFPVVRDYYSKDGRLMAMPFNTSIPVMFYNADVLATIGYDAESFPNTWDELEILAAKLRRAGFSCAYTTGYPPWVFIESFSALHGLPMFDAEGARANYNNQPIIHHLERLLRWQKLHYFEYGGRTDDATILFTSGRCPLYSQSSGGYHSLVNMVPFRVGVASLPMEQTASSKRFNNLAGGAALWVIANQTTSVYQGVARFFVYLARPDVQQAWHQKTGYLPLGMDGIYQPSAQSSKLPTLILAKQELMDNQDRARIIRFGLQNQVRIINDEALETIFAGIKSPKQAMDDAVARANHAISRFQLNTKGDIHAVSPIA